MQRTMFAELWMGLASAGLMFVAFTMMLAPFIVSMIVNVGRRVPSRAVSGAAQRRVVSRSRSIAS